MPFRRVFAVCATLAVVAGLAGCAAHDSTGRVSVALNKDAPDHAYTVRVFDSHKQLVEHQRVYPGTTADFAGVPLGKITVAVPGICRVGTTVTTGDPVTVQVSPTRCTA